MTSTAPQFPEISGYTITEQLYLGSRTAVYRAVHNNQQLPVVIKVLQREYPTFGELVQFRNQYVIAKNLSIAGIVQPLNLETLGNGYALVMADWGGISLEKYIQHHQLDLTEKLAIAIQLADILRELHSSRVIHKDIKPANILIHPESKQVKLIDFSIASLLSKETQEIQNPNVLEGTLAYLAPEQTGRMNRGIDYRSDFYAFGVTLYQLFTGCLPFVTDDPLELVHCHIAKIATPVHQVDTDVPSMVGAIVAKLMAKNTEDRYQSATGLKHDLAECLNQWKEIGSIAEFELGQRDLCDRFLIPEKLYGREAEVQTLLDAFERVSQGSAELMLVAGYSGVGKTAVVNEIHKPITRQRGYFIKGKFDQFNRNIPFSAFVQAFRSLMGQLLSESDTQMQQWKSKILQAVGESGQVLIEVIPELERIIGSQPAVPELSGSAAQNRFNLLLQKFIAVFTTPEHPLVMFLDDLQWADSASLNLLNLLMAQSETGYLLVLGAYRDNEVFPAHPLMLTLEDIKKYQAQIHTLTLKPLTQAHIHQLVADTLLCKTELAKPLGELVYQKTQGNPFFATQFLQGLYEEDCITFEATMGYWQCDLTQVRQLALTDNVVEFMVLRLRKLPEATQEVLKLSACMGNRFELDTLALVCEKSQDEVATDLWQSLQDGLIIPQSETYKFFQGNRQTLGTEKSITVGYRFLHDRVQQAAYALLSEDQKQTVHLAIGRQLWHNLSAHELDEQIFTVVNHLNHGKHLISDQAERSAVAQLNLRASQKAKLAIAYEASCRYCQAGQQLLNKYHWQDSYPIWFELSIIEIEAEFFRGNLDAAERLSQTVLTNVETLLDRIRIHELQILFEIHKNQMTTAIELAIDVLALLGITIPQEPQSIKAGIQALRQENALPTEEIANLVNLEAVQDDTKLAALRVLTNATSAAYIASPLFYPMIVLQTASYCIKYGNSALAASAYSWYGALLCGIYNEIESGYEFGKLSIQLLEKFNAKELIAKVSNMFNVFIRPWKEPLGNVIEDLPNAIRSGFENGDVEYALYATVHYCNYLFYSGEPLDTISQTQARHLTAILKAEYGFHEGFLRINQQVVANLRSEASEPQLLQGDFFDRDIYLQQWQQNNIVFLLLCFYEAQTRLNYLFGDYQAACLAGEKGSQYQQAAQGTLYAVEHSFYYSLALLAQGTLTPPQLECIEQNQKQLNTWAFFASANFQHKYDLVEAERHRISSDYPGAIIFYDRAIAGAKENKFVQEEALANELAAKFYLDWGKEKIASGYMQEAYYCYARWGAKAKINDLEERYPNLLRPILQSVEVSTGTWNTLTTISPLTTSVHSSTHKSSSSTSINQALDFAAILKSSQALSSTIELDQLLHQLTQIILQNSGADNCALILPNEIGEWQVRAIATPDDTQLCAQTLANNPNLPAKLIQYVKNTQEIVVIDGLKTDLPVIDDYLMQNQPSSVLCLPLLNQGQPIGILYLKNQFTIGAFTSDRVEMLNFLCTQAAISLENARLYQKAQAYAQQLEQSQLQVVQSEKMASLGNLVAGVAHEINNPIGFLNGSIKNGKDYVQDLFEHLQTYQEQQPPNDVVQESAEEIDLEFLLQDLPKLLDAMKGATDRIKSISTSLRTFSRADTDHKVSANLHKGLDSTLLILKYRLKANDCRPAIQITKDYGDLPTIECFPGQLNQVFMNILANAIDMFDEMAQTQSFKEIEANPQQITIRTQIESNQVYIRIRDNGKGMSEDVQAKIFDHLFTTKEVGKGTGLGLAIARQIVVEKHGGSLNVWSELGQGTEFCVTLPIGSK